MLPYSMCELPGVVGLNSRAIGANPLAHCTSNPSGVGWRGGAVRKGKGRRRREKEQEKEQEKEEKEKEKGGSLVLSPLLFSDNSHTDRTAIHTNSN